MLDKEKLSDPTGEFIQAVKKNCRIRGDKIAKDCFEGTMADVMGEVFGDMLVGRVMGLIGNSLYDVPMLR